MRELNEVIINGATLEEILNKHKDWYYSIKGGIRADLRYANLRYADLSNADLRYANLRYADLRYADLSNANLRYADLSGANLRYADLSNADLSGANLSGANLSNADLRYADLSNVFYNEATSFFALQCPEEGSFIAYKKARSFKGDVIVKLLVTENAKRSSSTTRKCRCSEAKVLSFYDCSHNELSNDTFVWSSYDKSFIYKIGEIVKPTTPFDDNRWDECSTGIYFFITFDEAKNY